MFSLQVLQSPNVSRVVISQLLSQVCDKLMIVAIMWMITDSFDASWITWYVVAGGLPHLLLTTSSGFIIEKIGTLRSIIGSEVWRGILWLLFAWYLDSSIPSMTALLVVAFLVNMGSAIFNPAILSLPLTITDDDSRPQVNAMIDGCFSLANIIGPVLSVVLYAKVGLKGLMIINGVSYLIAAFVQSGVHELKIHVNTFVASEDAKDSHSIFDIFQKERLIGQMLFAFLAINIFGAPFVMLFPLYVKQVYQLDLAALATLETSFGLGAVVSTIYLSLTHSKSAFGLKIVRAIICVGLSLVVFSLSKNLPVGSGALFCMGLSLSFANVWILTLFQSIVASNMVPSVMGVVNLVSVAATPISLGITGLIMPWFQTTTIAFVAASAFLVIGIMLLFIRRLKEV